MFGFESFEDRKVFVVSNTVSLAFVAVIAAFALLIAGISEYEIIISLAALVWISIGAIQFEKPFFNAGSDFNRRVVFPAAFIVFPFAYLFSVFIVIINRKK